MSPARLPCKPAHHPPSVATVKFALARSLDSASWRSVSPRDRRAYASGPVCQSIQQPENELLRFTMNLSIGLSVRCVPLQDQAGIPFAVRSVVRGRSRGDRSGSVVGGCTVGQGALPWGERRREPIGFHFVSQVHMPSREILWQESVYPGRPARLVARYPRLDRDGGTMSPATFGSRAVAYPQMFRGMGEAAFLDDSREAPSFQFNVQSNCKGAYVALFLQQFALNGISLTLSTVLNGTAEVRIGSRRTSTWNGGKANAGGFQIGG